nr:didemethylasterriquinone d synthetase tdia [Quercus suber]
MHAVGSQVFVPASEIIVEPHRFVYLLGRFKIGYTFAPNFFLAAVVRSMQSQSPASCTDIDLSHLSVIMCGGEANKTETLDVADKMLRQYGAPKCSIKAAYGLSETCSACFYNLDTPSYDVENQNTFSSVGKPLPNVLEMKIVVRDGDDPQSGQGLVYLRGDLIFQEYHNNQAATSACMSDDGWMDTGDIGKIDREGNLHLLGRAKEVLILNGQNYSSFDIEHAVESSDIAGLTPSYTAAFSTWDQDQDSEAVVILFNPTEAAIGPKNLLATVQAIEKGVFAVCAQKPKHIIALPKNLMPKSTIGKLSRAKLKQQFEAGAYDDYLMEHPQLNGVLGAQLSLDDLTPLQQEITRIYASVVNVSPEELLRHDTLLASGINSMGFMRLKTALEKGIKIQQEIPMPLLTRCHSIVELEHELVKLGTVPQQYSPIVALATKGSKQPLFLLHPGAGEFLCWIGLLEYLPDRPVYALRAKGLHPGEGIFSGLEEMLDCYYTWIRRTQPKGPYAMLGYCFGGLLGYELSKKFEADGEQVVFCGAIDNPPSLKSTIGQVRYRLLMIEVLPVVSDLTEDDAREFAEQTADLTDDEFFARLYTKFPPEFIENMGYTVPRLQAYGRVEDCMRLIAANYEPEGEVQTMDIFCADPMPHFGATPEVWKRDVLGDWRRFVKGQNVKFHEVQGTHISMIKEPLIHDFQRIVNEALVARGI